MRFCVGCGNRLDGAGPSAAPNAAPQIAGVPPAPQVAGVPVAPPQPAVPAASAPAGTRCWRCASVGDPGAAFCKYCGARYDEAPGVAPTALAASVQAYAAQAAAAPPAPAAAGPAAAALGPVAGPPAPAFAPSSAAVPAPPAVPVAAPAHAAPVHAAAPASVPHPGYAAQTSGALGLTSPGAPSVGAAGEPLARLVAILKDGSDGRAYPIHAEQADIGRSEGDIVLGDDPYLSPRHARLRRRGDAWVVRDLDSVNGVYIRLREPVDLTDGDMVLLGQQVLRFELLDEGEQPLGPAMQHGVLLFGTPETPRAARLVQYTTEGVGRDVHYLYRDETVLGRENGDIVFTDDPFLSRKHCAIALDRGAKRYVLRDLGSSNGTSIRITGERVLQPGDQLRVGRHLFRFEPLVGGAR
jgi:pSer/pThr/pTyr-binding forkhead associated (FHA) protein